MQCCSFNQPLMLAISVSLGVLLVVYFVFPWYHRYHQQEIFPTPSPKKPSNLEVLSPTYKVSISSCDITPEIKGKVFLLIFINSIPKTAERRHILRETWTGTARNATRSQRFIGTESFHDAELGIYCVFLVAFSGIKTEDDEVFRESYKYRDILRVKTNETYRNMINKLWGGFQWATKVEPKFLMKVDDDVYVDTPHLMYWLSDKSLPEKLYAGWILHHGTVVREESSAWYVSQDEFSESKFPGYAIGPFYIFSGNLLRTLLMKKTEVQMFSVEDAYLGVLMRDIGISPLEIRNLFVWDPGLSKKISDWNDQQFLDVICLGERLTSELIQYIHERYQKIPIPMANYGLK